MTRLPRAIGWALLGLLVLAFIIVPFVIWEDALLARSREWLAAPTTRFAVSLVVVLLLAADLLLPIPSSFIAAGAVGALGPTFGAVSVWAGMTLGCLLGYFLGRTGGAALAERVVGAPELERVARFYARFGPATLIVCRGVPVLAEATTLSAGAFGMRFGRFALLTSGANLGLALAYALLAGFGPGGLAGMLMPFALGIVVPAVLLAIFGVFEKKLHQGSSP